MESSSSDQTNYIKFSLEHFKSIPGYLKIAQVVSKTNGSMENFLVKN